MQTCKLSGTIFCTTTHNGGSVCFVLVFFTLDDQNFQSLRNIPQSNQLFFFGIRSNFSMLKASAWYDRHMMVERCKRIIINCASAC